MLHDARYLVWPHCTFERRTSELPTPIVASILGLLDEGWKRKKATRPSTFHWPLAADQIVRGRTWSIESVKH